MAEKTVTFLPEVDAQEISSNESVQVVPPPANAPVTREVERLSLHQEIVAAVLPGWSFL